MSEDRYTIGVRSAGNYCATCGSRTYDPGGYAVRKCDGCDHAPSFCTCVEGRREAMRRRMEAARSRATVR